MIKSSRQIIFILIISAVAATYATSDDANQAPEDIGDQSVVNFLRLILENIQGIVINGNPYTGVLPLDPYIMGSYQQTWNDTADITQASASITNGLGTGMSGLTIDNVAFDVSTLTGNITITIPLMDVTGDYSAQGIVSGVPSTATGSFDVKMSGAIFNVSLALGTINDTFQVTDDRIEFIIQNTQVIMTNLQGDPKLEAQLQQNAIDLYNTLYSLIPPKLQGIADTLTDLLDSIFSGIEPSSDFQLDMGLLMWKLDKLGTEIGF